MVYFIARGFLIIMVVLGASFAAGLVSMQIDKRDRSLSLLATVIAFFGCLIAGSWAISFL